MRVLYDTHIVLACVEKRVGDLPHDIAEVAVTADVKVVSVVSLWEIAIKWRLGKLPLTVPLALWPRALTVLGFDLLVIDQNHVLTPIAPELEHKDPFDRLLLGICAVENLRLLTLDKQLIDHPLAWRPIPSVKK